MLLTVIRHGETPILVQNRKMWLASWQNLYSPYLNCISAKIARVINTFVTSCLLSCTQNPFRKEVDSIRNELAPLGSKFFPFRVGPFLQRTPTNFDMVVSSESVSIPLTLNVQILLLLRLNKKCICL